MSRIRCSLTARELDLSPLGTATPFRELMLVATPSPWPKDASDVPSVRARLDECDRPVRAQLISGADAAGVEFAEYRAMGERFQRYRSDQLDGAVVLVCCHGRRDTCCGGDGTRLAVELEQRAQRPFSVMRTSHLGGHRFAPTALVLPEGTMWAYADADFLVAVVNRSIPVEQALSRYRGCSGLPDPAAQVADAGALLLAGWEWLDEPRHAEILAQSDSCTEVRVSASSSAYRALVGVRRMVPTPACGEPITDATPVHPELELLAIRPDST